MLVSLAIKGTGEHSFGAYAPIRLTSGNEDWSSVLGQFNVRTSGCQMYPDLRRLRTRQGLRLGRHSCRVWTVEYDDSDQSSSSTTAMLVDGILIETAGRSPKSLGNGSAADLSAEFIIDHVYSSNAMHTTAISGSRFTKCRSTSMFEVDFNI